MTLGFESENLFLFEDGSRRLTVVDVAAWKAWWLDFEHLGFAISATTFDQLAESVRAASVNLVREAERLRDQQQRRGAGAHNDTQDEELEEAPTDPSAPIPTANEEADPIEAAKLGIARSTQALQALLPLRIEGEQLDFGYAAAPTGVFRPSRATIWIWASDGPAESYHAEDYEPGKIDALNLEQPAEFIDFGARFDGIRAEQHYYPIAEEGGHAAISLPADFASAARPDPLSPLPIIDDYVGPGGVGVSGLATNFVDDATFGSEVRMAIPLLRGTALFLTLYVHLWFDDAPANLATKLGAGGDKKARAALEKAGYAMHVHGEAGGPIGARAGAWGEVWTRGEESDVVHLYSNLPGRETLYRGVSAPILLAARAGGSFDPEARAALLAELKSLS